MLFKPSSKGKCKCKRKSEEGEQPTNLKSQRSEVEEYEEFLFMAMAVTRLNDENTWFLDSGCTQHMTSKREYFTELESAKGSVKLADKTKLEIVGKGTVAIKAPKVEMIKRSFPLSWNSNTEQVCQSSQCELVILTTKHNDDEQYIWKSQVGGSFTVTRDINVEQLGRGTKITLFLKEDQLEYLEEQRIKDLVKEHSEFTSYPIYLWAEKTTEKEISNDEDETKKDNEGSTCGEVGKATSEKPDVPYDEQLSATEMGQLVIGGILSEVEFWAARKRLLEQTENKKPKQRVALKNNMGVKPLFDGQTNKVTFNLTPEVIHQIFAEKPAVCQAYLNFVSGKMSGKEFWTKNSRAEYLHSTKNIVATFAEASEDEEHAVFLKQDAMLESEVWKKMNNVKLYVWRVFIMDNCEEVMPEYLGFVKSVVDSDDLPLNISREIVSQKNNILKVIRKNLVKKCIDMFNEIAETKEGLKLADMFTKALPKFRFETLREQLGVTSMQIFQGGVLKY
ncbi:putative DNA damage-inducible protein 1-like [Capsicum annuum]|nr:putative DNA damage-inducible protein 1-like [Capsicum annuum]KAF3661413.1 putative DNA damage-inducible protein 1-like [Capsicum annuum]